MYGRNLSTGNFSLIYSEVGNQTSDYYKVGQSLDLLEYNGNHATLFFTSLYDQDGKTYAFVNTIDLLRINRADGSSLYRTRTIANNYRDTSIATSVTTA